MSKADFIEYATENFGKANALELHLSANFYPPLPSEVKKVFLDAFNQYWSGMIGITSLSKELSRVYKGGLDQYGFDHFINEEDFDY
jgi:hypothetical protein